MSLLRRLCLCHCIFLLVFAALMQIRFERDSHQVSLGEQRSRRLSVDNGVDVDPRARARTSVGHSGRNLQQSKGEAWGLNKVVRAHSTPPRGVSNHIVILKTQGCSMSSAIWRMVNDVILAHGVNVWTGWAGEFLVNEKRNGWGYDKVKRVMCKQSAGGGTIDWSMDGTARMQQADRVLRGEVHCENLDISGPTVFSVKGIQVFPRLLAWSQPSRIRYGLMKRGNSLDTVICEVKDCMGNKGKGIPVHADGSPAFDLCKGHFRRNPKANVSDATYKVKLDTQNLINNLRAHAGGPSLPGLQPRYNKVPLVFAEDLTAFEYSLDEQTLGRSAMSWSTLMTSMGIPPQSGVIRQALRKIQNGKVRHMHRHSEEIFNAAAVKEVLRKAGPKYLRLWRE